MPNIFVYGLTAVSLECVALLERCSTEDIIGFTLFEVFHEATHKFMIAEAEQKGLFSASERGARYLGRRPNQVKLLNDYWVNALRVLDLNVFFLPMERRITVNAQTERSIAGLLTNDSIIVSTMREYGISLIATNDSQFEAVTGITVFSPTDVLG
jgi:predicted nucleic acid-binding protein